MRTLRVLGNLLRQRPILTIFDVTRLCNQRCPMCNIWRTESRDMSLEEIRMRIRALADFGVGYVFLQGGDPLMRTDILQIVDAFLDHGIKPTLITNGMLLTKELAREVGRRPCNLSISLDALDRDAYLQMRGVDSLDQVIQNIRLASGTGKHRGNWSITTTVTRLVTLEEVKRLEAFAHDLGFMYAVRPYVHVKGVAGKANQRLAYTPEDVLPVFEYMLSQARKDNYLASLIYEEHLRYVSGHPMPPCDAGRYSFLMTELGTFAPCIEFPHLACPLERFLEARMQCAGELRACNECTPCFYNDAREVGILWRKFHRVLLNAPRILLQLMRYGNFF